MAAVHIEEPVVGSAPAARAVALRTWLGRHGISLLVAVGLALCALNLRSLRPRYDIDSSFRIALSQAAGDGLRYGSDIAWPYGPLGYLAGPTLLSRPQLLLGIAYQMVIATVVFLVALHLLQQAGLRRAWAACVLVPFALALGVTENVVPEFVAISMTMVVVVVTRELTTRAAPPARFTALYGAVGALAGVQVLVKFSTGVALAAAVVAIAATVPGRVRNVSVAAGAFVLAWLLGWFATGQRLGDLGPWIVHSLDLARGYQDGQAFGPTTSTMKLAGGVLLVPLGILVVGAVRYARRERWAGAVPIAVIAVVTWFALKQSTVRWDRWHILSGFLMIATLTLTFPWSRKLRALPVSALLVAALCTMAFERRLVEPGWTDRADAMLSVVSGSHRADELDAAAADARRAYDIPDDVIAALAGRRVHAEEWDIAAVWAYGLEWSPLPNIQSYSAYSTMMDELNRDRYRSPDGPDGVLITTDTVDGRNDVWESPEARLALTCNFASVASDGRWSALIRSTDICGAPQVIDVVRAAEGTPIAIPEPATASSLVVAHVSLPADPVNRLATTIARPIRTTKVWVDGRLHRFLSGTASGAHIVRSPGQFDGRQLPHGVVADEELVFVDTGGGEIVVTFEEIPLG